MKRITENKINSQHDSRSDGNNKPQFDLKNAYRLLISAYLRSATVGATQADENPNDSASHQNNES